MNSNVQPNDENRNVQTHDENSKDGHCGPAERLVGNTLNSSPRARRRCRYVSDCYGQSDFIGKENSKAGFVFR